MDEIIRHIFIGYEPERSIENTGVGIESLKQRMGERIRFERKKLGLSLEQFAELINVSSSFLGLVERGERLTSVTTICVISKILNVPISYILGEEDSGIEKQRGNTKLDSYINMLNNEQRKKLIKLIQIVFFK